MDDTTKKDVVYVEDIEEGGVTRVKGKVMGTVKITEGTVVYIPTPTADPQGEQLFYRRAMSGITMNRPPEYVGLAKVHHSSCYFYLYVVEYSRSFFNTP